MNQPDASYEHSLLREVLARLRVVRGPDTRGEYVCWCPFHADGEGTPPHQPNLQVSERGFFCYACVEKGGLRQLAERLGMIIGASGNSPEAAYSYRDEQGNLLYQVCRYPRKQFLQRRPNGASGWVWNLRGVQRVLYRLPELLAAPDATVYVAEGEKDADRLAREGLIVTTNSGGAGKWRKEYAEVLQGRDVVILSDNDEPGRKHAQQVARSLHGVARSVKVVDLPGLPDKGDVSDWLAAGHTVGELKAIVEAAPVGQPPTKSAKRKPAEDGESRKRASQADQIVAMATTKGVKLFHDDLGDSFARVSVRDHREIWRCRSKDFRYWLARQFYESEQKAPSSDALSAALNVIEAKARFDGEEYRLHNRVAFHEGVIWYDLADRDWRAVRVTTDGWEIVAEPPILFRRYSHQRPQAEPARGGDLRDLLRFVNLGDPSQGLLLLVYIVCCFVPEVPHPIPVLHGPQGSAKTTLFRMLRGLVDPSATAVLSFPRDATELVQQLSHHWAPFYDNISNLPDWTSDLLCRAVTGEGFSKRELYSDDEDVIYQFRRCVGLNGVNVAAHKPDLLDRCILFGLEPIAPPDRRPEEAIWQEFEAGRPRLLGAIFHTLSRAIALRDPMHLSALPRMADFAVWGCAITKALGNSEEDFLVAYEGNTEARNEEALQASPIAAMVVELMETRSDWEGTPSELLVDLENLAGEQRVNMKAAGWPKAAHSLTRRLNEVRPNLAAVGIAVATRRDGRHRVVTIRKAAANRVTCATSVAEDKEPLELTILPDDATVGDLEEVSPMASLGEFPVTASAGGSDPDDANDASVGDSEGC